MSWELHTDHGEGVETRVKTDNNPVILQVFDDDEKVLGPVTVRKISEIIRAGEGYAKAKKNYQD